METTIRRVQPRDAGGILDLLKQVLNLHAEIRPDIFIKGTAKYTREQLLGIMANENTPVFVACGGDGKIKGYVFCEIIPPVPSNNMKSVKTLYIDDLCVDGNCRGERVGTKLFNYAKEFAKETGCYNLTLNVWEGNDGAAAFYKHMGMFPRKTQMEIILSK